MGSFSELNNLPPIPFTDLRTAGVKTNRVVARDISQNQTTQTFPVINTIEITEIIRPEVANVRYEIDTTDTDIQNVTWFTTPVGTTVSRNGPKWTISGIDSVEDWNLVKNPTITLPDAYNGNTFYTPSIIYDTETQSNNRISWTVGEYIPTALFEATVDVDVQPTWIRGVNETLNVYTTLQVDAATPWFSEFNMTTIPTWIRTPGVLSYQVKSSLNANILVTRDGNADISSAITAEFDVDALKLLDLEDSYPFFSEQKNYIFDVNPPQSEYAGPASILQLEIEVSIGEIGKEGLSFHSNVWSTNVGSVSQLNDILSASGSFSASPITYWPEPGQTTSPTLDIRISDNSTGTPQLINEYNIFLDYQGVGVTPEKLIEWDTAGSYSYEPSKDELLYSQLDYLVVGSGAGQIRYVSNNVDYGAAGGGGATYVTDALTYVPNSISADVGAKGIILEGLGPGAGGNSSSLTIDGTTYTAAGAPNIPAWRGSLNEPGGPFPNLAGSSANGNLGGENLIESPDPNNNTTKLFAGGGGGGYNGAGTDGYTIYYLPAGGAAGENVGIGGDAGPGVTVSLGPHTFNDLCAGYPGDGGPVDSLDTTVPPSVDTLGSGLRQTPGSGRQDGSVKLWIHQ